MLWKEGIKRIFPASCHKLDCERDKILNQIEKNNLITHQVSEKLSSEFNQLALDRKADLERYERQVQEMKEENQRLRQLVELCLSKNREYAENIGKNQNMMQQSLDNLTRLQKDLGDRQKDLRNRQEREEKYLREQLQAMRTKEQEIFIKARDNGRKLDSLEATKRQLNAMETMINPQDVGVSEEKRTPRIIVSMTSYPVRIRVATLALERLMNQTMKPDKIVLWLSSDQFPDGEEELPLHLIAMKERGLEIEWCPGDIKSYKKILPALRKYPEDIILTVDDDLLYDLDLVENLYEMHRLFPRSIIASRAHKMTYDEEGYLQPYQLWEKEIDHDLNEPRNDLFVTTGAGTLFPPEAFDEEIFNEQAIREICPYADDIWINVMATIRGTDIVCTGKNRRLVYIPETQEECLYRINRSENDNQLAKVIERYGERIGWRIREMEQNCNQIK